MGESESFRWGRDGCTLKYLFEFAQSAIVSRVCGAGLHVLNKAITKPRPISLILGRNYEILWKGLCFAGVLVPQTRMIGEYAGRGLSADEQS